MKLAIVYGTRPEFLKLKILIHLLRSHNISVIVVRINQHANFNQDEGYYDLNIDIPENTNERLCNIGSTILERLPNIIDNCTHVLAQGDTASVFYTLLCAFQMKKVCIHLEAGMRTYDLENPYPEEGYRQMISRLADIHLCPSETEKGNLEKERVKGTKYVIGNTILDLVKSYNYPITYTNEVIITLHRRENWDSYRDYIIQFFLLANNNPDFIFHFFTHLNPSLQKILNELKKEKPNNINIIEPVSHEKMIKMLASCAFVITDSGGIQEEANFLGKHMFVLRKLTERSCISNQKLTLCNLNTIRNIECKVIQHEQGFEYGDGNSCEKIIDILI